MEALTLVFADLRDLIYEIRIQQVSRPLLISLWVILLLVPLPRTDRRDTIAQMTYAVIIGTFGVLFLFIMPFGHPSNVNAASQLLAFIALCFIGSSRWLIEKVPEKKLKAK